MRDSAYTFSCRERTRTKKYKKQINRGPEEENRRRRWRGEGRGRQWPWRRDAESRRQRKSSRTETPPAGTSWARLPFPICWCPHSHCCCCLQPWQSCWEMEETVFQNLPLCNQRLPPSLIYIFSDRGSTPYSSVRVGPKFDTWICKKRKKNTDSLKMPVLPISAHLFEEGKFFLFSTSEFIKIGNDNFFFYFFSFLTCHLGHFRRWSKVFVWRTIINYYNIFRK